MITTGQDDISNTVAGAGEVLDEWLSDGKLPQGVELSSWYDRSTMIKERLQLLAKNALSGAAIVFLLLALFLNLTVAFWVAMGLPFIFFGALYFMGDSYFGAGLSLNEFTTFGFIMALGIVVDDAVVVGESVFTLRSRDGDTLENTIKGTLRVALPTLFGVFHHGGGFLRHFPDQRAPGGDLRPVRPGGGHLPDSFDHRVETDSARAPGPSEHPAEKPARTRPCESGRFFKTPPPRGWTGSTSIATGGSSKRPFDTGTRWRFCLWPFFCWWSPCL